MQPLRLRPELQVRPTGKDLQVRLGLQMRTELRLRKLTTTRRSAPLRKTRCSRPHRRMGHFAATPEAEGIFMPMFILITCFRHPLASFSGRNDGFVAARVRHDRNSPGFDR